MIYIQGVTGLQAISAQLTKEKIIAALGYTPADNNTFYEDESGALLIADEKGYVIARIDENGLTTTQLSAGAIALNGEDLAAKLKALEDSIRDIDIPEVDLSNYYNKTEVDNALKNVSVDLTGYAKEEDIPSVEAYDTHVANEAIHVTEDQKTVWNNKSDFSGAYKDLEGAPHIVNDNEDEVVICDSAGNVILRATAEGLNVAAVYINGQSVQAGPAKFYIRLDTDETPTEYEFIPGMNFKDWANSEYCTATIEYSTNSNYYRFSVAGLAILEDYDDYTTGATHNTSIYAGKTFYCRADGVEPVAE